MNRSGLLVPSVIFLCIFNVTLERVRQTKSNRLPGGKLFQMGHNDLSNRFAKYSRNGNVMANINYDWLNIKNNECYLAICTRFYLRLLICKIVLHWHKNPKRVWRQFEMHAFKINAEEITKNLLKKFSNKDLP